MNVLTWSAGVDGDDGEALAGHAEDSSNGLSDFPLLVFFFLVCVSPGFSSREDDEEAGLMGTCFLFWVFVVCRDEGNGRANTRLCVLLLSCSLRVSVYLFLCPFFWVYFSVLLCFFFFIFWVFPVRSPGFSFGFASPVAGLVFSFCTLFFWVKFSVFFPPVFLLPLLRLPCSPPVRCSSLPFKRPAASTTVTPHERDRGP
ncbi:hypothetical protein NC651_009633 [Populus alba x Populus x berolinensis]|nr:hypothetical protein NC651_009633 [Populus alba x Populus x berolinensis]